MNIIDSGKFAFVGLLPNVYYKFSLVFTSVTDVDEYVSELKLLCFLSLTNSPPPSTVRFSIPLIPHSRGEGRKISSWC